MPFLSGSLAFERFSVDGFDSAFHEDHIELLSNHAAGRFQTDAVENVQVGFLGGSHLFDQEFDLGKNLINDAVHLGLRVDTNQIPSSIKKAWLQIELAALLKDNPGGKPTKSQKKEAAEAVEQRCLAEAATGKYRKMKPFPMLWDLRQSLLYFGGAGNAGGQCADLMEAAFGVQLSRVSAGTLAQQWASQADRVAEIDDVLPACFVPGEHRGSVHWINEHSTAPDFLGNEFLLWLWWYLENESDTLSLSDGSEAIVMLSKSLSLECPNGENGKESITSLCPTALPEARRAVQTGKMPRKTGMSVVRSGQRFDLVLQAETFAISGAKIQLDNDEELQAEDRIDAVRSLSETVDLMFHSFCERRTGDAWSDDLTHMVQWLEQSSAVGSKVAA